MTHGKYFYVPVDKLADTLTKLGKKDFKWKELMGDSPIEKYYNSAINRDYGNMIPVLEVELYKHYKFIQLTTDRLIEINKDKLDLANKPILSFDELKIICGI